MHKKLVSLLFLTCVLCGCDESSVKIDQPVNKPPETETVSVTPEIPVKKTEIMFSSGTAGSYLCGRIAQHNHDWINAARFLNDVIRKDGSNVELEKRAMVMNMGSGNPDIAIKLAKSLKETGDVNQLVQLFLVLEAFKQENYDEATSRLSDMPEGGMTEFIRPLLKAWSNSTKGEMSFEEMPDNPIHLFHASMIAGYLGKQEEIPSIIKRATKSPGNDPASMENVGDIYAGAGMNNKAIEVYSSILQQDPGNAVIQSKILILQKNGDATWTSSRKITSPREGAARAFYDMARVLFGEYSDDSTRVFSQMALYLDPAMNDARILLAILDTRNGRFQEAIEQYQAVKAKDDEWSDVQKRTADLMARVGRTNDAVSILEKLVNKDKDIISQIQIGDIYRQDERFENALDAYNKAIDMLDGKIPPEFWHLYYVRGMTLERMDRWNEAEKDLLAALEYQPDHPYIMNYLGYGWTEQGIKYDEALELLEKAVTLQPSDGYIRDSLGWIYYRIGRYEEAIPHLEKSVEMLPYDPVINDHLGDAYWQVGRRLEAEFQWQRAKNYSEDEELTAGLREKLINGLENNIHSKETAESSLIEH